MHWLTIIGIILIATGTIFTYLGQRKISSKDILSLRTQIIDKNSRIDSLLIGNERLSKKIEEYQNTVEKKDIRISELESDVQKLNYTAPKLLPDGRIELSPGIISASEYSDGIYKARDEFNNGNMDKAYKIAEALYNKNKEFGLAQFLMGTIEVNRGNYPKGELLIKKSIKLGISEGDLEWAYHNLGVASLRQQKLNEAIQYLEEALKVNPKKTESTNLINDIKRFLGRR